jgi:GH15 family glucan-1,4-alpha-glucosidase
LVLQPRESFRILKANLSSRGAIVFKGKHTLSFWSSMPTKIREDAIEAEFVLDAGEEVWCCFGPDEWRANWTAETAAEALRTTRAYWDRWTSAIEFNAGRRTQVLRSAMLVHLLTFAPTGALIASPTTSLPERIGGDRNYDYRYTWIRDASLGLSLLATLDRTEDAEHFMDWLAGLQSSTGRPLQILYTIEGGSKAPVQDHPHVNGYQGSRPVRTGNAAATMVEIDSYGYLTDCALIYLRHGGRWKETHWQMIERIADYTARNWRGPGSSIWELLPQRDFLAGKVMSFVTLDRALRIAGETGRDGAFLDEWRTQRTRIFTEIMSRGWSERLGAFRQHYDGDALDAAALLIPLMNILPADHPRVTGTISRLVQSLEVNGFLHRFIDCDPDRSIPETIGAEEGAFLMCSFWLAQVLAQRGDTYRAEAILVQAETIAGDLGLFAEAVDARIGTFLGNTPLVFSQVEYARAAIALERVRANPAGRRDVTLSAGVPGRSDR